ncbi:MAG: hypothetical protein FH749_12025 [Firmicutes bacterium]|nr:hypothetical protein [Bacillota bacterium]
MEAIWIGTESANPEALRRRLVQQVESWQRNGLLQEFNETSTGKITVWDCKTENGNQLRNLERLTAQMLADYIVTELEPVLLKKLARLHHPHFKAEEIEIICDKVRQRLLREEVLTGESRRQAIFQKIEDYLSIEGQINVEGFLRFRLQEYQRDLLTLINQSADDYLIEQEYQDFINLLKYFVEIQEPRYPEVHLLRIKRELVLYDPDFSPIHREAVADLEGIDAIVSTLVTAAPQRVIVHATKFATDDELLTTINSIFDDRVCLCLGCERCLE